MVCPQILNPTLSLITKPCYMSYSPNSLKGVIEENGTTIGFIKGDTRSLDYSSYVFFLLQGVSAWNPQKRASVRSR